MADLNVTVNIKGEDVSQQEIQEYLKRGAELYPDDQITAVDIEVDGEYVDLTYYFGDARPFERIRRITGYLVGTLDRFNNAKRSEVEDRVKHSMHR